MRRPGWFLLMFWFLAVGGFLAGCGSGVIPATQLASPPSVSTAIAAQPTVLPTPMEATGVVQATSGNAPAGCWITAINDAQVYQRPSTQAAVFGVLPAGEKIQALYRTSDQWYGFDPDIAQAGNVGIFRMRWIQSGQNVKLSGACDQLPVVPSLPAGVCFAFPMVANLPVYASPSTTAQQLGALGINDYAAVIGQGRDDWIQVDLNSGQNSLSGKGWVNLADAGLNGSCDNLPDVWQHQSGNGGNVPTGNQNEVRIKFAKGAITWQDSVNATDYVFYAAKGQSVEILLTQGDQPADAVLTMTGADGKVLQAADVNRSDWRGVLPKTQDYHLHINAASGMGGMILRVTIYPLPKEPKRVQDTGVGYRLIYDGVYFHPEKSGYFQNEVFGLSLADADFFMNTNLEEAYYIMALEPIHDVNICVNTPPEDLAVDVIDVWRVNGVDYQHYHSEEGAAGNIYEAEVFRTYIHHRCMTVYLFTHAGNVSNFDSGMVTPYDRKRVMDELKRVFYTLVWP